jgi:hypothetical protein
MRAEALSRKAGGAIAFSRTGDLATADFGDANVIRKFGQGGKGRYACSCGAAGPFLPGIQDPFDKAQDQIVPSRLSARF